MELMHIFTGPGGYAGFAKTGMIQQCRRGNLCNLYNSYSRILCVMTSF